MTDELDTSGQGDESAVVVDDRTAKEAFAFSRTTGEYLRKTYADPDQLDLENWLLPRYATFIEPLDVGDNQAAVFDGEKWSIVSDYRGSLYWDEDGTEHEITELGVETPEGCLTEKPIIPPTVEEQTKLVQAQCKKRIYAQWDADQQWNALARADGYTDDDFSDCLSWVNQCRAARDSLLADEATLVTIDVTKDDYWPVST